MLHYVRMLKKEKEKKAGSAEDTDNPWNGRAGC